jgi:hypothetical protein
MSWSTEQQDSATAQMQQFEQQFITAYEAWVNGIQTNNPQQFEQQVQEVLRKWRAFTEQLQTQSESVMANQGVMNVLADLVEEMSEQKRILERLRSESVTREDQASSLNPKNTNSPYINILGLQRSFSSATRTAILIAAIVFGVIALVLLGTIGYYTLAGPIQGAYSSIAGAVTGSGRAGP